MRPSADLDTLFELAGVPRPVLVVQAHPDDETIATGALIAELTARGAQVTVLTATRGERGEANPGTVSPRRLDDFIAWREGERQAAARELGVARLVRLGEPPARAAGLATRRYLDSGMRWLPDGRATTALDVDAGALTRAPAEQVLADLDAALRAIAPATVIVSAEASDYGHPDHVATRARAVQAARTAGIPVIEVEAFDPDRPRDDARPTDIVNLTARLATVQAALRRYPSQLTVDGEHIVHVGGQRQRIPLSYRLTQLGPLD